MSSGGYQVLQGLYAIGSGGFFGKGLGNSAQKLGTIPEAQNDMIFSIVCEELGGFGRISLLSISLLKREKNPPDISFFMFLRCPEVLFYLRRMFTFYSTSCSASVSSSPVRTFTTLSTLYTKILPSPICPVYRTFFAASMT